MKTELDLAFESKDDPEATQFHWWAIRITLLAAYLIAIAGACGVVMFANWLLQ